MMGKLLTDTQIRAVPLNTNQGLWIRVNISNSNQKSAIDCIIATQTIVHYCSEIKLHESGVLRLNTMRESDYNTMTVTEKVKYIGTKKEIDR